MGGPVRQLGPPGRGIDLWSGGYYCLWCNKQTLVLTKHGMIEAARDGHCALSAQASSAVTAVLGFFMS